MGYAPRRCRLQASTMGWQLSPGIDGRLAMESVAAFGWNGWQLWRGISGRIHLESVAALAWNTHMVKDIHQLPDNTAEAVHKTLILAFQLCYGLLVLNR